MAKPAPYDWNADPNVLLDQPNAAPADEPSVALDVLAAIPRGIAGAVQDTYGLADTLTFDALPDWTEKPFGESQTTAGVLTEGVFNFAAGFVPVFGALGKVGSLSKFGRAAVAGAVTDFTVWDGNESRLSNLLREHADLEDPVTEFLAANDSDPEIVGRLKNALEGLALGSVADLLILSLRGVKKYRAKVAAGASKEEAARAVAEELKAEEFAAAAKKAQAPNDSGWERAKRLTEEEPLTDSAYQALGTDNPEVRAEILNERKRGAEAIKSRLSLEVRKGSIPGIEEADLAPLGEFIDALNPALVSDVGISVRAEGAGRGSYDFVKSLLTLYKNVNTSSADPDTVIHELWHSLSRYVDPKYIDTLRREYMRDEAIRLNQADAWAAEVGDEVPGTFAGSRKAGKDYRFRNFDEWFAEVMTDKTGQWLERREALKGRDFKAIVTFVQDIWDRFVGWVRAKGGSAASDEVFHQIVSGKVEPKIHNALGLGDAGSIAFNAPDAPLEAKLRTIGVDPTKLDVEGLRADIADVRDKYAAAGLNENANPRALTAEERALVGLEQNGLNLRDVKTADEVGALARVVEDILPVKEKITWEEQQATARALADQLGEDPDKIALAYADLNADLATAHRRLTSLRVVHQAWMQKTLALAKEAFGVNGTLAMKVETQQRLEQLILLQDQLSKGRSELGRGLGSLRMDIDPSILSKEDLVKKLDEAGGEKQLERLVDRLLKANEASGSAAVSKIIKQTLADKFGNVTYELWIQGILSNPRTAVVSGGSIGFNTFWRPFEMMMGGTVGRLVGEGPEGVTAGLAQLQNLAQMVPDAWKAAKHSWATEQNKIASSGLHDLDRRAITAKNLGLDNTPYQAMADTIGRIVRTPGRMLSAQDEFAVMLNYRAIVKERLESRLIRELGPEQGMLEAQKQLDKMVVDGMRYSRESLYEQGYKMAQASMPNADKRAWKAYAKSYVDQNWDESLGKLADEAIATVQRDITLTSPLSQHSPNKFISGAARVQALVQSNPLLKPFLPFIRTPTNVVVWAGQRFDVAGLAKLSAAKVFPDYAPKLKESNSRLVQDMLSEDPARRSAAIGRTMTGLGILGAVTAAHANGTITGRGPKDPNLRKLLEASGWQPYSIKIGDTYYSYARIDPLATLIGTWADAYDWTRWAPEEDRTEGEAFTWGIVVGLANNVTNKTYFTGLMRLTELLADPSKAVENTARGYAGSAVPNILASLLPPTTDDTMREARTWGEAMVRKLPMYSDELAPQRNLLGEPIEWNRVLGDDVAGRWANVFSPIAQSAVKDDVVWQELSGLERAFEPPRRMRNGMDLVTFRKQGGGQDAYDRWQELSGQVAIRGMKLKDALRKLIKSPAYQKLPAESNWEAQSPRVFEIKNVLEEYRAAAWRQVLREYPDLAAEDRRIYQTKRDLKRGVDRRLIAGA